MSFSSDLQAIVDRAKERATNVVRAVAVDLVAGMQSEAPVDTGRLRANFQVGFGSINRLTNSAPGTDSATRAKQALAAWVPGQTIYLTNSLPYARVAEYGLYGKPPGSANGPKTVGGFPRQAQGGFVRITFQNVGQSLQKAVRAQK
jgi:hypothetical protein